MPPMGPGSTPGAVAAAIRAPAAGNHSCRPGDHEPRCDAPSAAPTGGVRRRRSGACIWLPAGAEISDLDEILTAAAPVLTPPMQHARAEAPSVESHQTAAHQRRGQGKRRGRGLVGRDGGGAPVALRKAAGLPGADGATDLPESSWYSASRWSTGSCGLSGCRSRSARACWGPVDLMIIVGLYREAFGGGLPHVRWQQGTVSAGHHPSGLLAFAAMRSAWRRLGRCRRCRSCGSGRLDGEAAAAMGTCSGLWVVPVGWSGR